MTVWGYYATKLMFCTKNEVGLREWWTIIMMTLNYNKVFLRLSFLFSTEKTKWKLNLLTLTFKQGHQRKHAYEMLITKNNNIYISRHFKMSHFLQIFTINNASVLLWPWASITKVTLNVAYVSIVLLLPSFKICL